MDELSLTPLGASRLRAAGLVTVAVLVQRSSADLQRIYGVDGMVTSSVEDALARRNLSLSATD